MIDKSLRQHYQDGENVGPFEKGKNIIMSAIPSQQITPASIARNVVTRGIGKKLAGTGILSSLGPIGALLAMFLARKGMDFASKKWGEGGVQQALTSGFAGLGVGSPEEQRELRVLEKRRADMLQRKDEGKNYSENNLSMVTRSIAEAKGLDINNPNEMKNIDKPITQIQIEKEITGSGYGYPDPTKDVIKAPTDIVQFPGEDEMIQQQREEAAFRDLQAKHAAAAEAEAAAQRAYAARVPDPIYHQPSGNGDRHGGGGGQTSQAAADRAGGSW